MPETDKLHFEFPVKLGVTGGIGSGKSEACRRLAALGVPVIGADDLARIAVMPGKPAYKKLVSIYGKDILLPGGDLDRMKLRKMMADDPDVKKRLEQIIHPEVFVEMDRWLTTQKNEGKRLIAMEVPLLFEAGLESFFDYILVVTLDDKSRIKRIAARDNVSESDAEAICRLQMPESQKIAMADFVIKNNGSLSELHAKVDELYERLSGIIGSSS